MEVCPEHAISKNAEGIVLVDERKCVGCRSCEVACDFDVPQFPGDGEEKMVKCDLCVGRYDREKEEPPCVATCPTKALHFGPMDELREMQAQKTAKNVVSDSTKPSFIAS